LSIHFGNLVTRLGQQVIEIDTNVNAKLPSFKSHNFNNVIDRIDQIEIFNKFSELSCTQLGVIKHVIDQKA